MIITGALFADDARARDNKLDVSGGVVSYFTPRPDRVVQFTLVVLLQHGGGDNRAIQLELIPPNGEDPLKMPLALSPEAFNGEIAFQIYGLGITMPFDGRWVCILSTGEASVSLPMNVGPAQ